MALQDLTPQLRTRLSRMERAVGWFVILALTLLAAGFVYYVYNTAERKGWFVAKAPYYTFVESAAGLKVGDPVRLMGFDAGAITEITPMPAEQFTYNVFIKFELKSPNIGYIWTMGSVAKITTTDLLGKRVLEVTKGKYGYPTYIFNPLQTVNVSELANLPDSAHWALGEEVYGQFATNLIGIPLKPLGDARRFAQAGYTQLVVVDMRKSEERKLMTGIWNEDKGRYDPYTNNVSKYGLAVEESPAVTEQLQRMVSQVEQSLPGVFNLTNQIGVVLSNAILLTSNLNIVAEQAQPTVRNLAAATAHLDQPGALGEWLLPTNINRELLLTLTSANSALTNANNTLAGANTNLNSVVDNMNRSLDNLAGITSNLNQQVQANTNLLRSVSDAVIHADQFVQGLKRFWLFRHLFKTNEAKATTPAKKLPSPKDK
jgi:ABC-type transporter Mla subunit MlaD